QLDNGRGAFFCYVCQAVVILLQLSFSSQVTDRQQSAGVSIGIKQDIAPLNQIGFVPWAAQRRLGCLYRAAIVKRFVNARDDAVVRCSWLLQPYVLKQLR